MIDTNSDYRRPLFNAGSNYDNNFPGDTISDRKISYNPDNLSLTAEGGKLFFNYLKRFNLSVGSDFMMLSPNKHYYYDENELIGVNTLINLKKLNFIKSLEAYLHSLSIILPHNINFIGCFSDSKNLMGKGFLPRLSSRINNVLDLKTDSNLDKKSVSKLLEKYGFKVVDMTEMNGLTLFYAKNVPQALIYGN